MVNRTKSKRSRYIKSRKFRKSGGMNHEKPKSRGNMMAKKMSGFLRNVRSMRAPSMRAPSMRGQSMKDLGRGIFKNLPSLRKKSRNDKSQQNLTGIVPAAPPVNPAAAAPRKPDVARDDAELPRVVPGPISDDLARKSAPEESDKGDKDDNDDLRPPERVSGGKRNRYKKSKKGGRRTRKSRKLRRSRRR